MERSILLVCPIREFNFSSAADGSSPMMVVAENIDVSWATHVTLAVRWHDGTIASGASVLVAAHPDGQTPLDPVPSFWSQTACGSITIDSNDNAPYYETYLLASDGQDAALGAKLVVIVQATQANPAVTCQPRLSIELVLRRSQ